MTCPSKLTPSPCATYEAFRAIDGFAHGAPLCSPLERLTRAQVVVVVVELVCFPVGAGAAQWPYSPTLMVLGGGGGAGAP